MIRKKPASIPKGESKRLYDDPRDKKAYNFLFECDFKELEDEDNTEEKE